jgi:hypothetical protein
VNPKPFPINPKERTYRGRIELFIEDGAQRSGPGYSFVEDLKKLLRDLDSTDFSKEVRESYNRALHLLEECHVERLESSDLRVLMEALRGHSNSSCEFYDALNTLSIKLGEFEAEEDPDEDWYPPRLVDLPGIVMDRFWALRKKFEGLRKKFGGLYKKISGLRVQVMESGLREEGYFNELADMCKRAVDAETLLSELRHAVLAREQNGWGSWHNKDNETYDIGDMQGNLAKGFEHPADALVKALQVYKKRGLEGPRERRKGIEDE